MGKRGHELHHRRALEPRKSGLAELDDGVTGHVLAGHHQGFHRLAGIRVLSAHHGHLG